MKDKWALYEDLALTKLLSLEKVAVYTSNTVWELEMPDGNKFRYTWGEMIPFGDNESHSPMGQYPELTGSQE